MSDAILVIDHEAPARRVLRTLLQSQGYQVWEAWTRNEGLELLQVLQVRVILLEIRLPDGLGLELIDRVRDRSDTPILVVSSAASVADKVRALDRGADGYVVKPFRGGELLARIRVALRSARGPLRRQRLQVGPLRVHPVERRVYLNDKEVPLTPTEFSLLQVMALHAGQVVPHSQLLHHVWGAANTNDCTYLRAFVYQLRQKLEQNPTDPKILLTTPGVGYRLKAPA